jgi:hypothetical protein
LKTRKNLKPPNPSRQSEPAQNECAITTFCSFVFSSFAPTRNGKINRPCEASLNVRDLGNRRTNAPTTPGKDTRFFPSASCLPTAPKRETMEKTETSTPPFDESSERRQHVPPSAAG